MPQRANKSASSQSRLFEGGLTINGLEGWLWDAACSIRGAIDAPKFKDYILPLIFVKRLSDVFDDEVDHLGETFGDRETALALVEEDHSLVRFYIPPEASWAEIRKLTGNIGQSLTDVMLVARTRHKTGRQAPTVGRQTARRRPSTTRPSAARSGSTASALGRRPSGT